jgi:glycosyltransferase involved in cell wall biosynthesis
VKVLQLISSGGYYGAENMLLNLIGGDEVTSLQNLLAVFRNRHCLNLEIYDRAIEKGVRAEMVDCHGKLDWPSVRSVRRLVRANGIDLIHAHGYKADLYGWAAARLEGKAVVATCHNWLAGGPMLAAYNVLDQMVLKRFDAVSAVSQTVADKLLSLGVRRERVAVIPNGIDLHRFDGGPVTQARRQQVIGIVARLDLQKGFGCLLRALRTLIPSFPGLRLVIVGEGPDRAKIEELVAELGINGAVTMAGQQTDMPAIYASMDVFVLPSLNEGLPMTILEAMAARKPIIATRVGAIPTVINDGETGLLVEPGDEVGLTRAIAELLGNPNLCCQLAQSARARVEQNYTAAAMKQRYRELYQAVLKRCAGRHVSAAAANNPHPAHGSSSAASVTPETAKADSCALRS